MIIYAVLYITNYNVNYNQVYQSRARFLSIIDISDQIILCRGGDCPVHCSVFVSISGLYLLDASGKPPVVTLTNVLWEDKISPS